MCESVHPDVANNLFGHGTCFFSVIHCRAFSIAGNFGAGIHQEVAIELFLENESLS